MSSEPDPLRIPPIEEQYRDYVRGLLPRFEAPTDPAAWRRRARSLRRRALEEVYLRGFERAVVDASPRVVWGPTLRPDASYVIRKLRYEAFPHYWIPALLYEPTALAGKVPVVLNPNGHHSGGKAAIYKQARCANLARRGVLALSFEFIGMSELGGDPHNRLPYLDFTGLSAAGCFYLAMRKGLDVLLAHRHADPRRVAMTGLSGGGWQTIVLSALDERITLSVPVAGYTTVRARVDWASDIGDYEQCPPDLTTVLDYGELTALLAPRPALLILNDKDDCCFRTDRAKAVIYDAVQPTYRAFGAADRFAFHSNSDPGTHNYDRDNRRQFYRFLIKHFGMAGPDDDIHSMAELYTEPQLTVGLPRNQETFHALSLRRARELAARHRMPRTAGARRALRGRLVRALGLPRFELVAELVSRQDAVEQYRLTTGPWTLAAVKIVRPGDAEPELCLHEGGAEAHLRQASTSPSPGRTTLAADILGVGRSRGRWVWQQLVNTVGQRFLGVQAAQIIAVSRWLAGTSPTGRIRLSGQGMANAVSVLTAGALEPSLFSVITANSCPASFVHVVQQWVPVDETIQPVLCPGLLEVVDIPQLQALLEGVRFRQPDRCTRAVYSAPAGAAAGGAADDEL